MTKELTTEELKEKFKKEEQEKMEAARKEGERIRKLRSESPLDIMLNKLKIGDKIIFCTGAYHDGDGKIILINGAQGEVLDLKFYKYTPEKYDPKDTYGEQPVAFYFVKAKCYIDKEIFETLASCVEKV